jgi:predicted nucleic-acid-binding protein
MKRPPRARLCGRGVASSDDRARFEHHRSVSCARRSGAIAQGNPAHREAFRRLSEDNPDFVSLVAIAETAWVLERAYGLTDREIAAAIESMLQTDVLVLEHEQEVCRAMIALKDGLGSFADALIAALGTNAGCMRTLSLDRKASRIGLRVAKVIAETSRSIEASRPSQIPVVRGPARCPRCRNCRTTAFGRTPIFACASDALGLTIE